MAVLWLYCGIDVERWLYCDCIVAPIDSMLGYIAVLVLRDSCIVAMMLRDGCFVALIWGMVVLLH